MFQKQGNENYRGELCFYHDLLNVHFLISKKLNEHPLLVGYIFVGYIFFEKFYQCLSNPVMLALVEEPQVIIITIYLENVYLFLKLS